MKKNLTFLFIIILSLSFLATSTTKISLQKINNLIFLGKYAQAKTLLKTNLDNHYLYLESAILMGDILVNEQNYQKARKYFQKALKSTKNKKIKPVIYNKIADTYTVKKTQYKAIKILKEAVIEHNFNTGTYTRLAIAFERLGVKEQVFSMYEKAYALDPHNVFINHKLAEIYTENLQYEKAISHYQNILMKTNIQHYKNNLASLYFKVANDKKALELTNMPELKGDIYYKQKKYTEALRSYFQAWHLKPNDKKLLLDIYTTLLKLGKSTVFIEKNFKDEQQIFNSLNKIIL
ncbi:MAG: tetratricopeptide repeat protein [bacterium]|nr:tetratricopeptide repeat protein [bacterium]